MASIQAPESAQDRFNRTYITAAEIGRELGVTRPSVMRARERKLLPDPVLVGDGNIYIWERDTVRQYLDAWRINLNARRGQIA